MGLVYLNNVKETEIYKAYGLTVLGHMHKYVWTVYGGKEEGVLTSIRIKEDASGNDVFETVLGNDGILQQRIDDTLDNFLFWIAEERPDKHSVETQVYKTLCCNNSLFNHTMEARKRKKAQI